VKGIVILHFQPIELYPPIQNLLHELEKANLNRQILVLTTATYVSVSTFGIKSRKIKILRLGMSGHKLMPLRRYWNYLYFNTASLLLLILYWPNHILYFETLSSFPAYLLKRFFKSSTKIFIHYHEYVSNDEYQNGMTLTRYFHRLENYLYQKSEWISHTNKYRMELFRQDNCQKILSPTFIFPNYPPKKWYRTPKMILNWPLKIVYIGSLSLTTMYSKEFTDWVISQNGNAQFDLYSYNCDDDARRYFKALNSKFVNLLDGLDYNQLPAVLNTYDVGVILYKGHIPNYIFNAPNKLFEYLACGLDVWFPNVIIGSLEYCTKETYPEVLSLDFNSMDSWFLKKPLDRSNVKYLPTNYYSENVARELIEKLNL